MAVINLRVNLDISLFLTAYSFLLTAAISLYDFPEYFNSALYYLILWGSCFLVLNR
jgi:hypothetical protein